MKYSVFVEVAKRPMFSFTLTAELALESGLELPLEEEDLWLAREPRTPPTTAPAMTRIATGIPNLIQLLVPFFEGPEAM